MNALILSLMDPLMGWLLHLPKDAVLMVISTGTGAMLVLVRRFTTDQELLRRRHQDRARLNELLREARQQDDRAALERCRATKARIAVRMLKSEVRPLLVSVLPVALIATWCSHRVAYHPPPAGEPIEVMAHFVPSAAGQVVHMVPEDGIVAEKGWIQEISAPAPGDGRAAAAAWLLRVKARPTAYVMRIRHKAQTYPLRLLVGQRTYEPPFTFYRDALICAEVRVKPVELFGVVPGIPAIGLPGWVVAYLLLAVPSVAALRRVLRVY